MQLQSCSWSDFSHTSFNNHFPSPLTPIFPLPACLSCPPGFQSASLAGISFFWYVALSLWAWSPLALMVGGQWRKGAILVPWRPGALIRRLVVQLSQLVHIWDLGATHCKMSSTPYGVWLGWWRDSPSTHRSLHLLTPKPILAAFLGLLLCLLFCCTSLQCWQGGVQATLWQSSAWPVLDRCCSEATQAIAWGA